MPMLRGWGWSVEWQVTVLRLCVCGYVEETGVSLSQVCCSVRSVYGVCLLMAEILYLLPLTTVAATVTYMWSVSS